MGYRSEYIGKKNGEPTQNIMFRRGRGGANDPLIHQLHVYT